MRWVLLTVALFALLLLWPLSKADVKSSNDASRFGAMVCIGTGNGNALHPEFAWTVDKAMRDDGIYISDKPPLLNLIGGGALWVILGDRSFSTQALYRNATLLISTLPALITLWLLGWLAIRMKIPNPGLVTLLGGLTTLLTPYAVTIANHAASAMLMMIAAHLFLSALRGGGWWIAALLGFVVGNVIQIDVPVGLFVVVATTAALFVSCRKSLPGFLAGLMVALIAVAVVDRLSYGRWLPIYFQSDMYDYPGSVWSEVPENIQAYPLRVLHRAFGMTFGAFGLVWQWPLGCMAAWGLIRALRDREAQERRAFALWVFLCWGLLMGALIFNPSARGSDLGGGYGLRWTIALMPPLLLFLPMRWRKSITAFALWGALIVGIGLIDPWPNCTLSPVPPLNNIATALASHHPETVRAIIDATAEEKALGHFDHAMIHRNAGRFAMAVPEFDEALKHMDDEGNSRFNPVLCYFHLGICLIETDQPERVDETYEALLEIEPDNIGARNNWVRGLLVRGDGQRAYDLARETEEMDPENAIPVVLQIEALAQMGRINEALHLLGEASQRWPENDRLRRMREGSQ